MSAKKPPISQRAEGTVIVVGGSGGMSGLYRDVVEEQGWSMQHFEKKFPPSRRSAGKVALIVVMVGMVSHALLQQVRSMPMDGASVVYLRTGSVSALRAAVSDWNNTRPTMPGRSRVA